MPISINHHHHHTSMYLPVNSQVNKTSSYRSHCSSSYSSYPRYTSSSYSRSSSISDDNSSLSITGSSCSRDRSGSQESVLSRLSSKSRSYTSDSGLKSYSPSSTSTLATRKSTPSRYLTDYNDIPSRYSTTSKLDTGRTSKLSEGTSARLYSRTQSVQPSTLTSHRKTTLATTLEQSSGSCEEKSSKGRHVTLSDSGPKSNSPSATSTVATRKSTPSRYLTDYNDIPSRYSTTSKLDTGRISQLSEGTSAQLYSRTQSVQPSTLSSHRKSTLATTLEQSSGSCEEDGGYLKDRSSPLTKTNLSVTSVSSSQNGLNGLRNIGNTCFLNTVVQCLSNSVPLKEYLLSEAYLSDVNPESRGGLIKSFAELIYDLWQGENKVINTTSFKSQIQRFAPRFMGYNQQDAQEFLRYLLEGLHEDVNRVTTKPKDFSQIDDNLSESEKAAESWKRYLKRDNSKIVDLFVGQLKSTLKCTVCGHCSTTYDVFWDLSLPLPTKMSSLQLSQCLEHFTKEEVLDGDEMPKCSKCNERRKCTKGFTIQRLPKILVLHLKRFSPSDRFRKLSVQVEFPITNLEMKPYLDPSVQDAAPLYNLYAISNHSGTTLGGHYIAYCRHPQTENWYIFNDSRVSPIGNRHIVSSEAYILFYEQVQRTT